MNFFKAPEVTSDSLKASQHNEAKLKQLQYLALAEDFEAQADDARNRARILGQRIARLEGPDVPPVEVPQLTKRVA